MFSRIPLKQGSFWCFFIALLSVFPVQLTAQEFLNCADPESVTINPQVDLSHYSQEGSIRFNFNYDDSTCPSAQFSTRAEVSIKFTQAPDLTSGQYFVSKLPFHWPIKMTRLYGGRYNSQGARVGTNVLYLKPGTYRATVSLQYLVYRESQTAKWFRIEKPLNFTVSGVWKGENALPIQEVDTTKPAVALDVITSSHRAIKKDHLHGTVRFNVRVSDNHSLKSVKITNFGRVEYTNGNYVGYDFFRAYFIDTTQFQDGRYIYTVQATDRSRNTVIFTDYVTINNTDPYPMPTPLPTATPTPTPTPTAMPTPQPTPQPTAIPNDESNSSNNNVDGNTNSTADNGADKSPLLPNKPDLSKEITPELLPFLPDFPLSDESEEEGDDTGVSQLMTMIMDLLPRLLDMLAELDLDADEDSLVLFNATTTYFAELIKANKGELKESEDTRKLPRLTKRYSRVQDKAMKAKRKRKKKRLMRKSQRRLEAIQNYLNPS